MKYSINHDFARILATMNLFEALGQNEFTGKQYDEMRTAQTREQAKGTCWEHDATMRWVPDEFKPYSLKNMREDGFIIIARVEPFTKTVEMPVYGVINRENRSDPDKWVPIFTGTCQECENYRWNEMVGKDARQHTTVFLNYREHPIEVKRHYYTIDRNAFAEYLAHKFTDVLENR